MSHELRTPLTLMLGPVEDVLARSGDRCFPEDRALLTVAQRNGRRLQKLVNTLLDFSRIEAGRVQAAYEPTDLPTMTAELASNFRSACERAGLSLVVKCPPLPEPVYVDREMWEKVVLNLLANAFKFTFEGEIAVVLRPPAGAVELEVRDTGIGIPPEEIPHVFERFHRVEDARGRTQEGTGIGLALVHELVKLHGGSVARRECSSTGKHLHRIDPDRQRPTSRPSGSGARAPGRDGAGCRTLCGGGPRWLPDAESLPGIPPGPGSRPGRTSRRPVRLDCVIPSGDGTGNQRSRTRALGR